MKDQIAQGQLSLPLTPNTKLQQVAANDIGAFVTLAFEHPGKWRGTATDLAGDESSMDQIAEILQVKYGLMPWEDFEKNAGHEMTVMFKWFQDVGYRADIAALRQALPNLMSFGRWRNSCWPGEALASA
jgi:hypothetical protein